MVASCRKACSVWGWWGCWMQRMTPKGILYSSCDVILQPLVMLYVQNGCMPYKYSLTYFWWHFAHMKKNLTHRNSLLLHQICHVQFGEKISSHLATGSEFQCIFCIPSSLRNWTFFRQWPSNHFVPFHVIFHLDGNYTEILHTESILKSQAGFMT